MFLDLSLMRLQSNLQWYGQYKYVFNEYPDL